VGLLVGAGVGSWPTFVGAGVGFSVGQVQTQCDPGYATQLAAVSTKPMFQTSQHSGSVGSMPVQQAFSQLCVGAGVGSKPWCVGDGVGHLVGASVGSWPTFVGAGVGGSVGQVHTHNAPPPLNAWQLAAVGTKPAYQARQHSRSLGSGPTQQASSQPVSCVGEGVGASVYFVGAGVGSKP
jgi:hypothetical protein